MIIIESAILPNLREKKKVNGLGAVIVYVSWRGWRNRNVGEKVKKWSENDHVVLGRPQTVDSSR